MTGQFYPSLPQGWERSHVEQLLLEIAPAIGLGAKRLNALIFMMMRTRPADWTSAATEPVYFAPQTDTAFALGKSERALRTDESALEYVHGLIEKRVKANGARTSHGKCGIVFTRLIELVPDLIELRDRVRADRHRIRELVQLRSVYLRQMKRAIEQAAEDPARTNDFRAMTQEIDHWPHSSKLRSRGLDRLESHVEKCRTLCLKTDELLQMWKDSSGRAEENFRPFIQEYTEDHKPVDCNASIDQRTSAKAEDNEFESAAPHGASHCSENEHDVASAAFKSQFMQRLTPERLFDLASGDLQPMIRARQGDSPALRELHIIEATHDILPSLGINYSAWTEAANLMGDIGASLCVLILDANRDHPTSPVKSAGGTLRAMTRKYRSGKLNLIGSLIGLSRRRGFQ